MRESLINTMHAAAMVAIETGAVDNAINALPVMARMMIMPHIEKLDESAIYGVLERVITDEYAQAVHARLEGLKRAD